MTGMPVAAVLLAAALLAASPPPRRRLVATLPRTRRRLAVPVATGGAVVGAVLLPPPAVLALVVAAVTIAVRVRRRRRERQRRREGQTLAAALEVLVGELGVGAHPVLAFASSAAESDGAVGGSLCAVAARARLGADVAAGLQAMAHSSAIPTHWYRLAVCWQLAAEHGLPMSTLMRAAQRDIVERRRFTAQVEASLAGARATAVILAVLPVLGVLLGELIGARPIGFLFGAGAGGWLLVAGVLLICAGLVWSDRITDRVLA